MSDEMVTLCLTCANLRGCPLLVNDEKKLPFDQDLVITEENPRTCDQWGEISEARMAGRKRALAIGGMDTIHAIHQSLERGLEEERMDEVPDFRAMIREGMTVAEREEQLRFETDSEGAVLVDDAGQKTPRSAFPLRKYAAHPEGPMKMPNRVVMFWSPDQLIDRLLRAEIEAGWIRDDGSKRTKTKRKATPLKAEAWKDEAEAMVEKKQINVRRQIGSGGGGTTTNKAAAPAGNGAAGKVATPATGKKRLIPGGAKKPAEGEAAASSVPSKAASGAAVDLKPVLKAIEALTGVVNELKEALAAIDERLTAGLTITHDVICNRIDNAFIQGHKLLAGEEADVPDDPDGNSLLAQGIDIFSYVEGGEPEETGNDE